MSWNIRLVKNTVFVNMALEDDLKSLLDFEGDGDPTVVEVVNGTRRIFFDPNHNEHRDYLSDPEVIKAICRHKIAGEVCWSSDEGNNAGEAWGYRFDGKGGCVKLRGFPRIDWCETDRVHEPSEP